MAEAGCRTPGLSLTRVSCRTHSRFLAVCAHRRLPDTGTERTRIIGVNLATPTIRCMSSFFEATSIVSLLLLHDEMAGLGAHCCFPLLGPFRFAGYFAFPEACNGRRAGQGSDAAAAVMHPDRPCPGFLPN